MAKEFAIVICTYNGEKVIGKCLDAILSLEQLTKYVDVVMVVDNNSSDGTKQIVQEYEKHTPLIRYEWEERQGLSFARRHAVRVEAKWVIYVDDDNILDREWLVQLKKAVDSDHRIGIVNGAVIALPIEPLNADETKILEVMHRNLACTHLREPMAADVNNTVPIGAGLCVKMNPLKKIDNEGWLKLEGRCGNQLSSGEDGELCLRVMQQNYTYCSCYQMKLYHLIPKNRLTKEYTQKLITGLVRGQIAFLKTQEAGTLKYLIRKFKYLGILIVASITLKLKGENNPNYWKNSIDLMRAKAFLNAET